ncbi:GNAT family N-acetyltransferase [Oceanimonas sp. CHS3-5]|uniref:GNAT family N-acetyltransferase n=1 Tax=Oceanimonas sp. CHS3-5 TaxID=3068186 RepID=UPI00273E9BFB|nr:GNAT family N-acetyltransferase [Oceanimonas sp. CHS3-5]MDP5293306.1 GNAT family N-acetyltransferase [Oceanimonas sp. CHS3-5]
MHIQLVPFDNEHQPAIRAVRNAVFIEEQHISPELEFDGLDDDAIHVLLSIDGQWAGTGRMLNDGHIGRIAVRKEFRGLGLGAKVVQALVDEAAQRGLERVYLGAQKYATGFYRKLGFTPYGDEFLDAGIVHISMEKALS